MSAMTDIATFINARLDWDEAVAKDALNDVVPYHMAIQRLYQGDWHSERSANHITLNDPARVLAQVAAMRAIVELHQPPATTLSGPEWVGCFTCIDNPRDPKPCPTVHALAAIWRDHEDYDPAWAPEGE